MANTVAEAVIRRDRNVVIVGLTAVIMVSAIYTINITRVLVGSISVLHHSAYTQHGFLLVFIMWTVMQIAMMSPTAVPMILMHAKIERHRQPNYRPYLSTFW